MTQRLNFRALLTTTALAAGLLCGAAQAHVRDGADICPPVRHSSQSSHSSPSSQGRFTWKLPVLTALFQSTIRSNNPAQVLKQFQPLAQQGHAEAQYQLGRLYRRGEGVAKNYHIAHQCYTQAAAQGHAGAQNGLGVLYENGWGVDQNYQTARQWYAKAAAQNHASALYNLGMLYDQGAGRGPKRPDRP